MRSALSYLLVSLELVAELLTTADADCETSGADIQFTRSHRLDVCLVRNHNMALCVSFSIFTHAQAMRTQC